MYILRKSPRMISFPCPNGDIKVPLYCESSQPDTRDLYEPPLSIRTQNAFPLRRSVGMVGGSGPSTPPTFEKVLKEIPKHAKYV